MPGVLGWWTYPFSPLRIAFTTSFTPRFTCLCFEATALFKPSRQFNSEEKNAPFLIVLCSFFSIFFCARGCAIGERSSKGMTISSFSFLALFSTYNPELNGELHRRRELCTFTNSASPISTSSSGHSSGTWGTNCPSWKVGTATVPTGIRQTR